MFYNVGAVVGAIIFGMLSERIGRRYSMLARWAWRWRVMPGVGLRRNAGDRLGRWRPS